MKKHSQNIGFIAGALAIVVGVSVILGWLFQIDWLLRIFPGMETMKWNTAMGFVMTGVILILRFTRATGFAALISFLSVSLVLLGGAQLLQEFQIVNLGIDELFINDYIATSSDQPYPGRMSGGTALCFLLVGLSQILIGKGKFATSLAGCFNHFIVLIALISFFGYLYDIPNFHRMSFLVSMAFHTTLLFFVIGAASTLLTPKNGLPSLFIGDRVGHVMARRLFPLLAVVLVILGLIWVNVYRTGLVEADFGISLFVLIFTLIGLMMIWLTARSLNKIDRQRRLAESALRATNNELELKIQKRTYALTEANNELKRSNERNRIFVSQAPNAIAMFDLQMCYLAASEQWYNDYGLVGKDIIGKSHYEIFPEIGEDWKNIHQACMAGDINRCEEASFEREDGSTQWIKWEVRPWFSAPEEIGGILMYTEDITRQKLRDQEKRHIEDILNKTSDIARMGTWEVDLKQSKIMWDRITREIHEVKEDFEPDMESAIDFYVEGIHRENLQKKIAHSIETGESFDGEFLINTAKGNNKWVRSIGQAEFKNGECVRLYGLFQDIDLIRTAQQELNKVNQELTAILDSGTHVSIISTDLEGKITHFSKGAETLLGYTSGEMVGKHTPSLIHFEQEVIDRGNELSELHGREIRGFDVFVEAARQGSYENREWTYVSKDGKQFPVQLIVTGIRDAEGKLEGYLGIATDISQIKEKENKLKEVNDELEELATRLTNQNRQLANFAQITSHNLRAPVSNLMALLGLYKNCDDDEERELLMDKFGSVIHHLSDTLHDLMEALKIQNQANRKLERVRFKTVLDKTLDLLAGQILEYKVSIHHNFDEAPEIMYDSSYMDSIFLNLISNAIKYRSDEHFPDIEIWTRRDKDGFIELHIQDNGLGINLKRHGKKIFGLHKTFHRNKDAKGVGLYLTKTQVEASGGEIGVESEVGEGSEFWIKFNSKK